MNKLEQLQKLNKFVNSKDYLNHKPLKLDIVLKKDKTIFYQSISQVFDDLKIQDGMTISFHHHLRNGDYVLNLVLEEIKRRNLKDIHLAPSAIFSIHEPLVELIKNGNIINISTSYMQGPVSDVIQDGYLKGLLLMHTHGGRARAIEQGDLNIDVAFLASPQVDKLGNGHGANGKSACGTLGYAISDLEYAKKVVLVTDEIVEELKDYDFDNKFVDAVLEVDRIGNPSGIVSGTTKITRDPIGLLIAKNTATLLDEIGLIKPGFNMQTGAGGTSLAVAKFVKEIMILKNIEGHTAFGGITSFYVDMVKEGLFKNIYDVQCFDLESVKSYANHKNKTHFLMSASEYGNPYHKEVHVNSLDFVILGATEIDLNFNVNATTDSFGKIIGGSGGHSDTAHGAKVSVITANLLRSRIPIIKKEVTTITTPGEDIDILVTERGIAINPKRKDLIKQLKNSKLNILTIEELYNLAHQIAGVPNDLKIRDNKIIGGVIYRDGTLIDYLYQTIK